MTAAESLMSTTARSASVPSRLRPSPPGSTTATTWAPVACTALVTAEPMNPAAPVTTTRSPGSILTTPSSSVLGRMVLRRRARDRLVLEVAHQPLWPEFAADPAGFVAAEWRARLDHVHVDTVSTGPHPPGYLHAMLDVRGPHGAGQA